MSTSPLEHHRILPDWFECKDFAQLFPESVVEAVGGGKIEKVDYVKGREPKVTDDKIFWWCKGQDHFVLRMDVKKESVYVRTTNPVKTIYPKYIQNDTSKIWCIKFKNAEIILDPDHSLVGETCKKVLGLIHKVAHGEKYGSLQDEV